MILDEITLHNFGLYLGRQTLRLTPEPGKPVILIGGLNGGGKTTLLDALQLALYGKFARCSGRGSLAYEEFLRQSISRSALPEDGASLEVELRRTTAGVSHRYRVCRYWSAIGNTVRESVEVYVDGQFDGVLTSAWAEQVDDFLPVELSQLFFFDGEKIEAFANFDSSARVLRTAIDSLLGTEVVERLATDLVVLERRKLAEKRPEPEKKTLDEDLTLLEGMRTSLSILSQERAALQNELDRAYQESTKLEARYEQQGGLALEHKGKVELERAQIVSGVHRVEADLRDMASGALPLFLVKNLIQAMLQQDDLEQEGIKSELLLATLKQRDHEVLAALAKASVPKSSIETIRSILRANLPKARRASRDGLLGIERKTRLEAEALLHSVLPNEESRCLELLSEEAHGQSRLLDADRVLARVPTPEVLEGLLDDRTRLATALTEILARKLSLDHEVENTTKQIEKLDARVKEQLDSEFGNSIEDEETQRILQHSRRVRATLEAFQGAVIRQNVSRIEALVMDCLNQLLRKQSLVTRLHIDPDTCSLELYGADNSVIRPERLSAGERQLLAVALLWGLGRAAGKPLPVVIDTPMGRLDSVHRQRLVEKYFPRASHQVLLLSTDEEIDAEQFHRLKPFISHVYRLDFDPSGSSTRVVQGYFEDKE